MPALRILIAQTRADILASALAQIVRSDPQLSLCGDAVVEDDGIEAHLGDFELRPDVLIIIDAARALEMRARLLAAADAALIVVRIGLDEPLAHVDFHHAPLDGLIAFVRSVAHQRASAAATVAGTTRYPLLPGVEPTRRALPAQLPADPHRLLGLVTTWLEAVLRNHLAQRANHPGDVPGFGISHATIAQAASGESVGTDPQLVAAAAEATSTLRAALAAANCTAPLAALVQRLGLSDLEWQVLLLCLAPELEHRYQRIFGYLHDDLSRRYPSLALLTAVLGEPLATRCHVAAQGGLLRWKLLRAADSSIATAEDVLHVDAPVVAWLLGSPRGLLADPRLERLLRAAPWPGRALLTGDADRTLERRIAESMTRTTAHAQWLVLMGEDLAGWRALLESAAERTRSTLLRIRFSSLTECTPEERQEMLARTVRAACLIDAVIAVDLDAPTGAEAMIDTCLRELNQAAVICRRVSFLLTAHAGIVVQALEASACSVLTRSASDVRGRERMFLAASEQVGLLLPQQDARRMAGLYAFDIEGIERSVRLAKLQGTDEAAGERPAGALLRACRAIASTHLPHFARRIEPCFGIDDVVLPPDRHVQLRELVAQVTHADTVLETWGFKQQLPYGRGVAALFSGPSGTGKTMAAQAIARQLDTELYIVDLARIVSKYIGETEKNLDAAFNDAERASAVLLFDEADALFGKRSDVKDSHDRYANIEVAYLLQRMETYSGVAILTTNLRQNLDPAFLRRLRFIIEFPKPDAAARERIWQQCLHAGAPRDPDLDLTLLARRVDITGGNIRQITLRAAFAAAAEGAPIAMRHVFAATRAELRKLGRGDIDLEAAA